MGGTLYLFYGRLSSLIEYEDSREGCVGTMFSTMVNGLILFFVQYIKGSGYKGSTLLALYRGPFHAMCRGEVRVNRGNGGNIGLQASALCRVGSFVYYYTYQGEARIDLLGCGALDGQIQGQGASFSSVNAIFTRFGGGLFYYFGIKVAHYCGQSRHLTILRYEFGVDRKSPPLYVLQ